MSRPISIPTTHPNASNIHQRDMTGPDRRSGAMMSKVGNPQIYEDHEQRTSKHTDHNLPKKHVPDQWHIDIDQLDEREIGDRMAEAHQHSMDVAHGQGTMSPGANPKVDPLGPATFHGNEPSRGAKIDAEIMAEECEELKRKGKA